MLYPSLRSAVALAGCLAAGALGAGLGCGPDQIQIWVCLNPATGKLDNSIYDSTNFVNGVADPCHCFDPCGPAKTCPDLEDAGELPPECDAGDGGP